MNQTLQQIDERNRAKDLDKAWETSNTRKAFIAAITYVCALVFLWSIQVPNPALSALVPVGGFLLSTVTLSPLKRWWIARQK